MEEYGAILTKAQLPGEQILLHFLHTGLSSLLPSAQGRGCIKLMLTDQHGPFQHETDLF